MINALRVIFVVTIIISAGNVYAGQSCDDQVQQEILQEMKKLRMEIRSLLTFQSSSQLLLQEIGFLKQMLLQDTNELASVVREIEEIAKTSFDVRKRMNEIQEDLKSGDFNPQSGPLKAEYENMESIMEQQDKQLTALQGKSVMLENSIATAKMNIEELIIKFKDASGEKP